VNTRDFFAHVLPREGPYCILAGKDNPWWQLPAEDIDEAVAIALAQDKQGYDVWFAVGALKKARMFDPTIKDRNGNVVGGFRTYRTGENIRGCRSYTMDIDAGNGRAYDSTEDAFGALDGFVKSARLPLPTIVQSGFGLHVYWTLTDEVPEAEWEAYGKVLVAMAQAHDLRIDAGRTKDSSSVLRVVGTHNHKYPEKPEVTVLFEGPVVATSAFHALLGLQSPTPIAPDDFGSNTTRDPVQYARDLDPAKLYNNCQLFRYVADPENQKKGAAAISEPMWSDAVELAVHCTDGRTIAHNISKLDPRYDVQYLDAKITRLIDKNIGPKSCAKFLEHFKDWGDAYACYGCPHFGKITSPAQVAQTIVALPPPTALERVEGQVIERVAPELPEHFIRTKEGIAIGTSNPKTGANESLVFCPYDMYPIRTRYDEVTFEYSVAWNVKVPLRPWSELEIKSWASQANLRQILADLGLFIAPANIKIMETFMTAYMKKLQAEQPSEKYYNQLGWRDNGSFALGNRLYTPTGIENAFLSIESDDAIEKGIRSKGTLAEWKDAISIYNRPGCEVYRCYFYATFASVLFGLTGETATIIGASGEVGVGKSTLLDVCASVWGNPKAVVIRGARQGSTINALEGICQVLNSLPLCLDEITDREDKDVASFILNYSGGKGKKRSKVSGGVRSDVARWSNLCLWNANADTYAMVHAHNTDSEAHTMRLIQMAFSAVASISRAEGTMARQQVWDNYGHAGHMFVEYVVKNREQIDSYVHNLMASIEQQNSATPKERFWIALVACCQVAAEIADKLKLLPNYPVAHDIQWFCNYLLKLRVQVAETNSSYRDKLADFIDHEFSHTLVIDANTSGNISNVAKMPYGEISIRRESDPANPKIFISRAVLQTYCNEHKINMQRMLDDLFASQIVLDKNIRKVLAAGTNIAMGQIRCVSVDLKQLGI
jgi:hypothetical protein